MDFLPTYDDLPWDLILAALQGGLSPEEELLFRQWLALRPDNQEKYKQLEQIWKDGLADYELYREADPEMAWELLQQKIADRRTVHPSAGKRALLFRPWIAAAVLLLLAGAGWWVLSRRNNTTPYETAGEQKKISLPDGSTVVISPQTRIELAAGYNKSGRTIILAAGEARFDVSHDAQLPFTVEVDEVSIKDIGTDFTVQKTKDSIKVTVSAGKVAFIKKMTGESREISAGNSLVFYVLGQRFGDSLRFYNSPLSNVIASLERLSGKRISLSDTALGQKRLTIDLNGLSFDNALKIICTSLNLEYAEEKGEFRLKIKEF
jgi:transmembrane sensor